MSYLGGTNQWQYWLRFGRDDTRLIVRAPSPSQHEWSVIEGTVLGPEPNADEKQPLRQLLGDAITENKIGSGLEIGVAPLLMEMFHALGQDDDVRGTIDFSSAKFAVVARRFPEKSLSTRGTLAKIGLEALANEIRLTRKRATDKPSVVAVVRQDQKASVDAAEFVAGPKPGPKPEPDAKLVSAYAKARAAEESKLPSWLNADTYKDGLWCPYDPDKIIAAESKFAEAGYAKLADAVAKFKALRSKSGDDFYRLGCSLINWGWNLSMGGDRRALITVSAPMPTLNQWTLTPRESGGHVVSGTAPAKHELEMLQKMIGKKLMLDLLSQVFTSPVDAIVAYGPTAWNSVIESKINDGDAVLAAHAFENPWRVPDVKSAQNKAPAAVGAVEGAGAAAAAAAAAGAGAGAAAPAVPSTTRVPPGGPRLSGALPRGDTTRV